MYSFIREGLGIKFYHADRTLDVDLHKIFTAIKSRTMDNMLIEIFAGSQP